MKIKGTTIICTKKNNQVAIGGDGQATFGDTVLKQSVSKIKRLYNDTIISGMAGSTADAFNLYEKFEAKLQKYQGIITVLQLKWQETENGQNFKKTEAMMLVANKDHILLISGSGDVIEPDEPMIAIGSGGNYALSAGKALYHNTNLK